MKTILELRNHYYTLLDSISQRKSVMSAMGNNIPNSYEDETEEMIVASRAIKTSLAEHYRVESIGARGTIETVANFVQRMQYQIETDDEGNAIKAPKFSLGVEVIDNEWLNGQGVSKGCLISLGADSGVGKTELSLMMMQSFVRQDRRVLFASLEMGDQQLYDTVFMEGKFDSVLSNPKYAENLHLSFDVSNIDDLADAILIAHKDKGIDVFVIDSYLPIETGHKNSRDNMDSISKMLDEMKRVLNITIILIAQWSRSDSKEGYYDFSGGTTLKYLSDFVLFIEKFENSKGTNTMRKLTCAKNRVFPQFVDTTIITDYDFDKKRIIKVCDANSDEAKKLEIKRDKDGKILKTLKF